MCLQLAITLLASSCSGDDPQQAPAPPDVLGPFGGQSHRFVVDAITLPMKERDFAFDLGQPGRPRNQLGNVIESIGANGDGPDVAAQVASGRLSPEVSIQTTDASLENAAVVGLTWTGGPGDPSATLGGVLSNGAFASNATRYTTHPVTALVHLPLFKDSDPVGCAVEGAEILLTPDGAGYRGELHGVIDPKSVTLSGWHALEQMVAANPDNHRELLKYADTNHDGVVSLKEFTNFSVIGGFWPDVRMFDAEGHWKPQPVSRNLPPDSMTFGFGFHLIPCEQGRCQPAPAPLCNDRIENGLESDIDCGGATCRPCPGGAHCNNDTDCDSVQCANGRCAVPSCTDGRRDGLETDIDCGEFCPVRCATGHRCIMQEDCGTNDRCTGMFGNSGACIAK